MIKFIIIDNKTYIRTILKKIIHCKMMNRNENYKIYEFNDYTSELKSFIKNKTPNQIYFIDVKLPSGNGIDIAKKIRSLNDWDSVICFLSMYYNMAELAYKERLLITEFIWKQDQLEIKIADNIDTALKILSNKRMIYFYSNKVKHQISLDEIICIERDTVERKLVIKTEDEEFIAQTTIKNIFEQLDDRFMYIQRGVIVNKDFVNRVDFANHLIYLNNNKLSYGISSGHKKELKENVTN